jgi:hypothetical protein
MEKCYKPGTDNQKAGKYVEVDSTGKKIPGGRTCTIEEGDRLPATSAKGNMWKYSK